MLNKPLNLSSPWIGKILLFAALLWPISALPRSNQNSAPSSKPSISSPPKFQIEETKPFAPTAVPSSLPPLATSPFHFPQDLTKNSFPAYERSTLTKTAYGILGTGLAVSAVWTATLAGLNWGPTDAASLYLGNTCGPLQNMSCGYVKHEFNSGVYTGISAVTLFATGLIIMGVIEHFEKKKHPLKPQNMMFNTLP